MIVSFLHDYIFIKTKKTGGTTVEVTLSASCGPKDIVTPLGPRDEIARAGSRPVCRNFASDPAIERGLLDAIARDDKKAYLRARKHSDFFAHMSAAEIRDKLAPDFWARAFKFTVERHPYEKAVSAAYFKYRPQKDKAFDAYLDDFLRAGTYSSWRFYTIDDNPAVDEFIRQETLLPDLKRIGARLGVPIPDELVRTKTKSRADKRPAREILNDRQKEIVYEFCRKEFDLLGYER